MRLVRVKAPEGSGGDVAKVAFDAGIGQVTTHQQEVRRADGRSETKDVVDVETATPTAKKFVDALMSASFFDPKEYSIAIRQPRTVVSRESPRRITWPFVEITVDVFEELWQYSHVTISFVVRVFIGGLLMSYGMIESNLLLIIAGLLFLPLLRLLLAVSFGACTRQWRLSGQAVFAFVLATALLVAAGAAVAAVSHPPLRYDEFGHLLTGALISLVVGLAAALASTDDVGERNLIGLAATAQMALIPAWVGISLVFGFGETGTPAPRERLLSFLVNILIVVVSSLVMYVLVGMRAAPLRRFTAATSDDGA